MIHNAKGRYGIVVHRRWDKIIAVWVGFWLHEASSVSFVLVQVLLYVIGMLGNA